MQRGTQTYTLRRRQTKRLAAEPLRMTGWNYPKPGGDPDRVLQALKDQQPLDLPELAVRCWRMFPERFGVTACGLSFPDVNKVLTQLVGKRGLVNRGFVTKNGRLYSVEASNGV